MTCQSAEGCVWLPTKTSKFMAKSDEIKINAYIYLANQSINQGGFGEMSP